jgi:hypothetical protein
MIERQKVQGKAATVAYLNDSMELVDKAKATLIKILFDDGSMVFAVPARKVLPTFNPNHDEKGRFTTGGGAQPPAPVPIDAGTMDEHNSKEISRIFNEMPQPVLNSLAENGCKLHLGNRLGDVRPDLKGKRPRGWLKGMTWESAEGLYDRDRKEIVSCNQRLGWNGEYVDSNRKIGVLYHETGHAFDQASGDASRSPEFIRAYNEDVHQQHVSGMDTKPYSYFLQSGNAGRSETWAECFALINGWGTGAKDIRKVFPNSVKVIKDYIKSGKRFKG